MMFYTHLLTAKSFETKLAKLAHVYHNSQTLTLLAFQYYVIYLFILQLLVS